MQKIGVFYFARMEKKDVLNEFMEIFNQGNTISYCVETIANRYDVNSKMVHGKIKDEIRSLREELNIKLANENLDETVVDEDVINNNMNIDNIITYLKQYKTSSPDINIAEVNRNKSLRTDIDKYKARKEFLLNKLTERESIQEQIKALEESRQILIDAGMKFEDISIFGVESSTFVINGSGTIDQVKK